MSAENDIRWLRSLPVQSFAAGQIDEENGIIHDVVMVEEGPAKGHGVHLESEFVTDLVAYDIRVFGSRGVPARFGHPGASDNTMGMQMGHYQNIRKRKGDKGQMQAIGDLHLLDAAEISPSKPNMKSYVLRMAKEAPDFMMSSIVFKASKYYQKKDNGHKHYVNFDEFGDPINLLPDKKVFVEFGETGQHYFTDLVDKGAATDSLFSAQANPHLFVSQAQIFFSEQPALLEFVKNNPAKVLEFLTNIGVAFPAPEHTKFTMASLTDYLFGTKKEAPEGVNADELAALKTEFEAVKGDIASLKTELQTSNGKVTSLTAELKTATDKVDSLTTELKTAKDRVTELEAIPGEKPTKGKTESGDVEEKAYMQNPITKKAKARFNSEE
jgi:hypothetical protein